MQNNNQRIVLHWLLTYDFVYKNKLYTLNQGFCSGLFSERGLTASNSFGSITTISPFPLEGGSVTSVASVAGDSLL